MRTLTAHNCRCPCGAVVFSATREPLLRVICHCTLCQQFNAADHADVIVYRRRSVLEPPAGKVEFTTLRAPPNVARGVCTACRTPAIEVFDPPLMPGLIMVPRAMFAHGTALPQPELHIFYGSRRADHADELPKVSGYFASQTAFARRVLPRLVRSA